LWPVIHASHFQPPGSASAQKILATSGHTSPDQYELFDLDYASLKMSKATSPSDSERSLENWNQSVTRRRGEYSARLKSAHRTSGSGSSSWPTIRASEYKDTGPIGSKSHDHMLGKGYLCAVVTQDAANWPTPDASNHRDGEVLRKDNNLEQGGFHGVSLHHAMTKYGQAAPANPSTDGSRQGLSEQSQRNWQTFAHGTHNRGETPHRQVVKALVNGDKAKTQCLTVDQVFAEEIKGTNVWPTITAHTPDMESSGPNGNSGTYLAGAVKQWATPNAFCYQPPENTEQWTKRAEYQQTEKGVNLHKPIQTQVLHEVEKQWRTPSSSDGEGGVMEMREGCAGKYKLRDHVVAEEKMWRTPSVAEEKNQNTSTQIYLQNQVGATPKAWATPQLQDGHNINQDSTTHKTIPAQLTKMNMAGKLNPRWVETLMGLPVGWVMPSCKSPVTIEPTNYDSSETESCLPQPSELFAF
jgi:hypothetical protein